MDSVEVIAKSLDEARQQAASLLNTSSDNLDVTILEETKGLFGRGSVKILARPKVSETPAAAPAEEQEKPKRGRSSRSKKEAPAEVEAAPEPEAAPVAEAAEPAEAQEQAGAVATDADAEDLANIVKGLLSEGDLSVTVNIKGVQGRYANLEIDGKDAAHLVGKHGEVINALQYLVNIIASKKVTPGVRATLDAGNYRRRREEALTALAQKIADQVVERQEEAVLDALPAFERRIIHKALAEHGRVETYSEGEEPNRRVVVAPSAG